MQPARWFESVILKEEEDDERQDPLSFTQLLSSPSSHSPQYGIQLQDYPPTTTFLNPNTPFLEESLLPCSRTRAKRGCATHPRSIAERVRRTRISDRIRKLQELVPNMDKQTNTADMLDEAVAYVKFLQKQIEGQLPIFYELRNFCRNCQSTNKGVNA